MTLPCKSWMLWLVPMALLVPVAPVFAAPGGATRADAIAMVKKGVAAIKAQGADKIYAEISDKANPTWRKADLYLSVYTLDGVMRAHGVNGRMIGRQLIELKDLDGKPFVKERLELARHHDSFWQEYRFMNPETRAIEPKRMYCERLNDAVVCGGIYRSPSQ